MPLYDFKCKKCDLIFEELCKIDNYENAVCICGSKEIDRIISGSVSITFQNPKEGSKFWDNFEYRAGVNMEKAKEERRFQQANDPHGPNPYKDPDLKIET